MRKNAPIQYVSLSFMYGSVSRNDSLLWTKMTAALVPQTIILILKPQTFRSYDLPASDNVCILPVSIPSMPPIKSGLPSVEG